MTQLMVTIRINGMFYIITSDHIVGPVAQSV